jgi:hypothetical protein
MPGWCSHEKGMDEDDVDDVDNDDVGDDDNDED